MSKLVKRAAFGVIGTAVALTALYVRSVANNNAALNKAVATYTSGNGPSVAFECPDSFKSSNNAWRAQVLINDHHQVAVAAGRNSSFLNIGNDRISYFVPSDRFTVETATQEAKAWCDSQGKTVPTPPN